RSCLQAAALVGPGLDMRHKHHWLLFGVTNKAGCGIKPDHPSIHEGENPGQISSPTSTPAQRRT
ncbi:hypothetical protein CDV36_016385, partial [Fusarium kuroshium]